MRCPPKYTHPNQLREPNPNRNQMNKSSSIANIAKALQCFQSKMGKISKDSNNPFFKSKYASLSTILEHIQQPLAECGLSFSQLPDGTGLTTIIMHGESGEFLESTYDVNAIPEYTKEKDSQGTVIYRGPAYVSPQNVGSAITYARRYALGAALGLNIDEDDDGNKASGNTSNNSRQSSPASTNSDDTNQLPWLSQKQYEAALVRIQAGETGVMEKLKQSFRIKKDYREALENALKNKK
jgi:hypothetical protein